MGRIGTVESFKRLTRGGDKLATVRVDLGGGEFVEADMYTDGGSDAPPVRGDLAAVVPGPGTGEWLVVAFLDPSRAGVAAGGERITVARNAAGAVVSTITQAADGSVRMENNAGWVELAATGIVEINGNFKVLP